MLTYVQHTHALSLSVPVQVMTGVYQHLLNEVWRHEPIEGAPSVAWGHLLLPEQPSPEGS